MREPEESTESAFEIYPKQMVVGSRETQEFQVSFTTTKGVGSYSSVLLCNPVLSSDEIQILDENDDLLKKGALGLISLTL